MQGWCISAPMTRLRPMHLRWLSEIKFHNLYRPLVQKACHQGTFLHTFRNVDGHIDETADNISTHIPSVFSSSAWQASDWALHVSVSPEDAPTSAENAIEKALTVFRVKKETAGDERQYSARELLEIGAVYFMRAKDMNDVYKKPSRLGITAHHDDTHLELMEGDYLRIHHNPRRFLAVDDYDWTLPTKLSTGANQTMIDAMATKKERVVVEYNAKQGYLVLNKPSDCIPVHPTVDNSAENIVACLKKANPELEYVTTPHRLDQNTSGLITLATSKTFAAYFAKLLRCKTAAEAPHADDVLLDADNQKKSDTGVHKAYRCLVCLIPPPDDVSWSVDKAIRKLQSYASDDGKVLRHFLEPSIRAPKRFVADLPKNATTTITNSNNKENKGDGWAECLMRITRVGNVCALRGNTASEHLARSLWQSSQELMPPTAQAVVEIEVELLTGRTHQIRGQLSVEGFPLVGDVPYGGAVPCNMFADKNHSFRLGLQCFRLDFLDPDVRIIEKKKKRSLTMIADMKPSTRWNYFEQESAWWTPYLKQYEKELAMTSEEDMTFMPALDVGLLDTAPRPEKASPVAVLEVNPDGLPPQAILSPGRHKYVLVKAIDPNNKKIIKWFVKSASIQECGGPYHRDVAESLVEWIKACGYRAVVTGGGRILYTDQAESKRALVHGFSYGYGRGDHALAAKTIKEWSNGEIDSAYDDSPDLY